MDSKIPWSTITGNYRGFEDLALAYVQDEYPQYNWKPTPKTRDGNKDAEAIVVFCFKDENNKSKVWMEAKYSTNLNNLPRYRLDSTIVSAIIDKQVKKIFFVTNINIKQNTRMVIIQALKNGLNFNNEDIIFCACKELEIWLLKKRKHFLTFFKGKKFPQNILNEIQEIDPPVYYIHANDDLVYKESLNTIYVNESYDVCFSLYSPNTCCLKVTSKDGMLNIHDSKHHLHKGKISYIKLNVYTQKTGINPCLELKLEDTDTKIIEIGTKVLIADNQHSKIKIKISKNEEIKNKILKEIREFLNINSQFSKIHTIFGPSGTGKSYLKEDIFNDPAFLGQNIIYLSFNYDQDSNVGTLLNLMLRFYFHLWSIEDVNLKFLPRTIPTKLKRIIKSYKTQTLTIESFKSITENKEEIFFLDTYLNKRIIVIDDAHKLDYELRNVLDRILYEFTSSKTKVFVLIIGQEDFSYIARYPNVNCESNELSLTQSSFLECMDYNNIKYKKEYTLPSISDKLSLNDRVNMFFIKDFIAHIIENKSESSEINVADILNQYIYTEKFRDSVLRQFKTVLSENDYKIQDLLHIIYFSLSGIKSEQILKEHMPLIQILIGRQLIKNIEDGRLVPIHDIYCDIFRDEYDQDENKLFNLYKNDLYTEDEKIRYLLSQKKYNIPNLLDYIQEITYKHQYYIVLYILSTIFKDFRAPNCELSTLFSKTMGKMQIKYYRLFYYYVYALGHTSQTHVSYPKMKQLNEHLQQNYKEFTFIDFMLLRADILGELINSAFHSLEIENIKNYSEEQIKLFEQIKQDEPKHDVSRNGAYVLREEIFVLYNQFQDNTNSAKQKYIELLEHCENTKFYVKCAIIRIRYARGLYHNNLKEALRILNEADVYLKKCNDSKWKRIKDFEISYVNVLSKQGSIDELKGNLDKLKYNLYNDYRRGLKCVCAYYLLNNRFKEFDLYFDEYVSSPRPMNNKDVGLKHHLQGIKHLLEGEHDKSLSEFKQHKTMFKDAGPSYKSLIEHNINEVNKRSVKYDTKFNVNGGSFESGTIYIEPRLW